MEFLRKEQDYHKKKENGLYCLKYQLTNDLNLNLAIGEFDSLYDKSSCNRRLQVLPIILPLIVSFVQYCLDVNGDISLSIEYRNYSQKGTSVPPIDTNWSALSGMELMDNVRLNIGKLSEERAPVEAKSQIKLIIRMLERLAGKENNVDAYCQHILHRTITPEMYNLAYIWTILFASSSAVVALVIIMIPNKSLRTMCYNLWPASWRGRVRLGLMLPLLLCPPLFLFVVYLVYAYRHATSSKKSKERDYLEYAEFLWTIVDTIEAGFEASGEILLQVWLLGPNILDIHKMELNDFISGIFFLEGATDIHKSIGKVIIALLTIVYSVGECYRVQKREAVNIFFDIFPIYISILLQVVARTIAFSLFFATVNNDNAYNGPGILSFLAIHVFAVFAINLVFSRHWLGKRGSMGWYEIAINVFTDLASAICSCLVYCNINPKSPGTKEKKERKCDRGHVEDIVEKAKKDHKNNTTFYTQFFFFLLVFVENAILASWPLIMNDACIVKTYNAPMTTILLSVMGLTAASGLCNLFFYLCYGHPWAAINGTPVIKILRGLIPFKAQ